MRLADDRNMLRLADLTQNIVDGQRIAQHAVTDQFAPHIELSHSLGLMVDVRCVRALLIAAGLQELAERILGAEVHAMEQDPPAAPSLVTPEKVHRLFDMVRLGVTQKQAAAACGISTATASRLRRGLLNRLLTPESMEAWQRTFGAQAAAGADEETSAEDAEDRRDLLQVVRDAIVDDRNAALLAELFRLVKVRGKRPSEAARQLGISKSHAVKLLNGTYPSTGPKTQQIRATWFSRSPAII